MTDYTPTTEQVRDGYRFDPEDDYYNPTRAGANAEHNGRAFDRWLVQVKAEAWEEGNAAGWTEATARHENVATYPKLTITNPYRKAQA